MDMESAKAERSSGLPSLTNVLQQEDLTRSGYATRMDLSPYIDIIERIRSEGGVGGELTLQDSENQRVEKRRLTVAAKQVGTKLTWRKADDGMLKFVLSEPGELVPGGRARRAPVAITPQTGRSRRSA
jgi:hypothetical protein